MEQTQRLQDQVVQNLNDHKGLDIQTLNVSHLTCITDAMIICTGTSSRHVQSLANHIITHAKSSGIQILGCAGEDAGEWILVDLGSVLVHIMQQRAREFYALEKLWGMREEALAEAG